MHGDWDWDLDQDRGAFPSCPALVYKVELLLSMVMR